MQSELDDFLTRRDQAMLELFYSGGLRLSELSKLDLPQLDLAAGLLRVHGKGNQVRELPVGQQARAALQAWLAIRRAAAVDQALFISLRGQRLSPRTVQLRVHQAGIRTLRRHLPEFPPDLRATPELLAQTASGATSIHTPPDFLHLARIYDQAHPRAHRRSGAATQDDEDDSQA